MTAKTPMKARGIMKFLVEHETPQQLQLHIYSITWNHISIYVKCLILPLLQLKAR